MERSGHDRPPSPRHHPFYCEENVWWLAQDAAWGSRPRWVVVVTNAARACALWCQKAAPEGRPVLWDYHVVLVAAGAPSGREIWDLDSRLPVPCPPARWLAESFRPGTPARHRPCFRVVDAATYVATFASDRRHMRLPTGGWEAEPPPWAPIARPGCAAHTLDALLDLGAPSLGPWLDLEGFAAWLRDGGGVPETGKAI